MKRQFVLSRVCTATRRFIPVLGAFGIMGAAACGSVDGKDGQSALLSVAREPAGANCAAGGMRFDTGFDVNRSGVLDAAEVSRTIYACDGPASSGLVATQEPAGANCPSGGVRIDAPSASPTYVCHGSGAATSVSVTPEPAGAQCPNGGQSIRVEGGVPAYVCNGQAGSTGATGAAGKDGADGRNGANGKDGANGQDGRDGQSVTVTPLSTGDPNCPSGGARVQVGGQPSYVCNGQSVRVTAEPPGANCTYGGQRLQLGDGPASYVCNGAPMATIAYQRNFTGAGLVPPQPYTLVWAPWDCVNDDFTNGQITRFPSEKVINPTLYDDAVNTRWRGVPTQVTIAPGQRVSGAISVRFAGNLPEGGYLHAGICYASVGGTVSYPPIPVRTQTIGLPMATFMESLMGSGEVSLSLAGTAVLPAGTYAIDVCTWMQFPKSQMVNSCGDLSNMIAQYGWTHTITQVDISGYLHVTY